MNDELDPDNHEKTLVAKLDEGSTVTLERAKEAIDSTARWQLVSVAITLRDRMHGIRGGAIVISPKAFPLCIRQVQDVIDAANDERNAPRYDAVVTEGKQAYETIDKSDTA